MPILCEPGYETFPDGPRLMPQILMWSEAMGTKSGKELAKDLDTLRQDVSVLAEHLSGFLGDKSEEVTSDVKQGVQKIRENVGEAISQTASKSRALARDGFDGFGQMIEDSIQERPFMMLAIAAGVGAILAARLSR
jgi:ElaB/YqjD/DUF883 family membrane-anchored ribosome-binding protein